MRRTAGILIMLVIAILIAGGADMSPEGLTPFRALVVLLFIGIAVVIDRWPKADEDHDSDAHRVDR